MNLKNNLSEIRAIWQIHLSDKSFRIKLSITVLLLSLILFIIARFLDYNEARQGFSFADPFLSHFNPVDLTWLTFILIYGALIVGLVSLLKHPKRMLTALQSYTLVCALRIITIYFLPLNAPFHIIPLTDPFVEFFGGGKTMLRDLFFSGHTATMFLLALTAKNKQLKWIFVLFTILVAVCVLAQHVHYTIDVVAAPVFAYTCYRISRLINRPQKKNK
jgi:membrane-associated phospholipid phosphatase